MPSRIPSQRFALAKLAVLALFFLLCMPAQGSGQGDGAATGATGPIPITFLYVCVQDDARVAIVDMESLEVREVISLTDLGFGQTAMPHDIAIEPDGAHWYVSLIGENRVVRFDEHNQRVADIRIETPGMLEVHPQGGLLLVTRSMSAVSPPSRIGIAEGSPWSVHEVDVLFPRPHGIVVDRQGRYAYTASLGENRTAAVDLRSERVELSSVPGPVHAMVQFALSPDGRTLVASGELSGELVIFSLDDPARPRAVTSVVVGPQPFDPLFAPDGRTVWVPVKGSDEVVVLDVETWTVVDRISGEGIAQPHALAFSPDGARVFVTNNNKGEHDVHGTPEPDAPAADGVGGDAAATGADGTALNSEQPTDQASLVVIDVESRTIEAAIGLGRNLTGLGRRLLP